MGQFICDSERYTKGLKYVIGKAWLSTAKIARKAGHAQTAYSALLQAEQADAPFSFIQSARLVKASGEPIRALQDLDKALEKSNLNVQGDIVDLSDEANPAVARMNAKVFIACYLAKLLQ